MGRQAEIRELEQLRQENETLSRSLSEANDKIADLGNQIASMTKRLTVAAGDTGDENIQVGDFDVQRVKDADTVFGRGVGVAAEDGH